MITSPFTVTVDTREQHPYDFAGLRADARQGGWLLTVTTQAATLASGDYSILGHEGCVAVERKSKADLFGTLSQGRERFVRELERLACMPFAVVVVEAEWSEVLEGATFSRLKPKTVYRSVIAWQQRYPNVHWWFVPGRAFGMATTYRVLERWWRERQGCKSWD